MCTILKKKYKSTSWYTSYASAAIHFTLKFASCPFCICKNMIILISLTNDDTMIPSKGEMVDNTVATRWNKTQKAYRENFINYAG